MLKQQSLTGCACTAHPGQVINIDKQNPVLVFSCKCKLCNFYQLPVAVSIWPAASRPKLDSNPALNKPWNDRRPVLWLVCFYFLFANLLFSFSISTDCRFPYRLYRFYCWALSYSESFPFICVMFSFTLSVCTNKGLVSDRISSVLCLIVSFSMYSLSYTLIRLHFIHF